MVVCDGMLYDIIGVADELLKLILITGVGWCAVFFAVADDVDDALGTPDAEMAEQFGFDELVDDGKCFGSDGGAWL